MKPTVWNGWRNRKARIPNADGLNDEQEVRRVLATVSPEQLAGEVWDAWGFENTDDEDAPTLESMIGIFRDLAAEYARLF